MSTRAVTPAVRHGASRLSDARLPPKNMGTRSWEGNKTATSAALHIPWLDGLCAFDAEATRQGSLGATPLPAGPTIAARAAELDDAPADFKRRAAPPPRWGRDAWHDTTVGR